jgi:TonB family protein
MEPAVEAPVRALPLPPVPDVNLADHKMPVRTGTFDSDGAALAAKPARAVQAGGFGESAGGPAGRVRTVAAGGFGEAETAAARSTRAPAATADFGTALAAAPVRTRKIEVAREAAFVPVEILDKPRPVYPEEARRARVQGAVAVRVVFSAAGSVRVVGVVRGLGHGLDEAASDAAARIRFRPAMRNGQPVDESAVVQIVFELA